MDKIHLWELLPFLKTKVDFKSSRERRGSITVLLCALISVSSDRYSIPFDLCAIYFLAVRSYADFSTEQHPLHQQGRETSSWEQLLIISQCEVNAIGRGYLLQIGDRG